MKHFLLFLFVAVNYFAANAQTTHSLSQYPSPMQEHTRQHTRIPPQHFTGYTFEINDLLPKPVSIYIPVKVARANATDLLIQFFGSKNIVPYATEHYHGRLIGVTVNLGSGSSVYERPFKDDSLLFVKLLDSVRKVISAKVNHLIKINHVIVSGFSAGYGAVRAILSVGRNRNIINNVLLLDGLHAGYIPDRKVLAEGGRIDSTAYDAFLEFCRMAVNAKSDKKFLFTHSEIFPGTFVSTRESAGFLLNQLGIKANPVLKWGPGGMQQISDASKNHFRIMGFAGNTAPDHVDHLENLYYFLNLLREL